MVRASTICLALMSKSALNSKITTSDYLTVPRPRSRAYCCRANPRTHAVSPPPRQCPFGCQENCRFSPRRASFRHRRTQAVASLQTIQFAAMSVRRYFENIARVLLSPFDIDQPALYVFGAPQVQRCGGTAIHLDLAPDRCVAQGVEELQRQRLKLGLRGCGGRADPGVVDERDRHVLEVAPVRGRALARLRELQRETNVGIGAWDRSARRVEKLGARLQWAWAALCRSSREACTRVRISESRGCWPTTRPSESRERVTL
jgi:hypothetical protein